MAKMTEFLQSTVRALIADGPSASQKYFHVIDLSRGIAAIAVLVWHFTLFFAPAATTGPSLPGKETLPFYGLAFLFYESGHGAVQFFWLISGFVFAHVYPTKAITTRAFVLSRLARLYPLHLLTLVVVAVLQWLHHIRNGAFQAFEHNDLFHFALNLFFASSWGLEHGLSFNGPIWSVSIEVLVYVLFWLLLPFLFRFGVLGPLFVSATFYVLVVFKVPGNFWNCGAYFFCGAAVYRFHASTSTEVQYAVASALIIGGSSIDMLTHKSGAAQILFFSGVLMALAIMENSSLAKITRHLRWIGDSTYGIYLWHFPVILSILLVVDADTQRDWSFFLSYITAVVMLARVSNIYFERPCRAYLRQFKWREAAKCPV